MRLKSQREALKKENKKRVPDESGTLWKWVRQPPAPHLFAGLHGEMGVQTVGDF
jgi:hypothetical protein